MHWLTQSLIRKSAVGTAAGLVISSLFFLALFIGLYRSQLEHERGDAASQVTRLLQASVETLLNSADIEGLEDIVQRLGREPGIFAVRIASPSGELRFASNPAEIGTQGPWTSQDDDQPSVRLLEDAEGRAILRSVHPIHHRPSSAGPQRRATAGPVAGILYVDFDAAAIRDKAKATTLLLMGSGALIVLINIAGGWWFIRHQVLVPVGHLARASQRLMEGDLNARIRLPGKDELAALGERFNRMAGSLRDKIRELEDKELFMQALVDAIPDGIRVIDQDFRVILSNATYRTQHAWTSRQPLPDLCYAATHGRDSPCPEGLTLCPLREVTRTEAPLRVVHRHQRADGKTRDVEIYAAPMRLEREGECRRMVVESIRDLQQEVRFSHEQRLSELGRLAAGVAHEIHNPLAALRMAVHAAEQTLHPSTEINPDLAREYLALVDQEVERCNTVTERLLKLSMPPSGQADLVTVENAVGDTLKLLAWEAETQGVKLEFVAEAGPLRVLASDSDLRMVTLNLAQNACHAMPQGGLLRVRCQRSDGQVQVTFEDSGVGIDPEDLTSIFEPFFSRRADGVRGTGLGLSITKAILEGHGGSIQAQSPPGGGSRFIVTLPDADATTGRT